MLSQFHFGSPNKTSGRRQELQSCPFSLPKYIFIVVLLMLLEGPIILLYVVSVK